MICSDNQFHGISMPEVKQPRDDFMDAKEAYEATNSIIDKYNTTEIQDLKDKILNAINAGEFSFIGCGKLRDLTKEYFKNKNYKIEITSNYFYTISWDNKEE